MNAAQWFMLFQVGTCLTAGVVFITIGKPWGGSVWLFYGLANIGWLKIAGGAA